MSTTPPSFSPRAVEDLLRDSSPYLSCDECFEELDTYVERLFTNPSHTDLVMQVHLAACGVCAEEAETLMELLAADA